MRMSMNRRGFLVGGAAVVGAGVVGPKLAVAGVEAGEMTAPKTLLEGVFGPLGGSLAGPGAWKPLPTIGDRAGWEAVPAGVKAVLVERAEKANGSEWPVMLATEELEFARNGNRTRLEALTFGRRARLGDLVLGECVEAKGRFVDQIVNGVWLICEESFWGVPAHLGAQKAGVGLADVTEPIVELFGAETAATLGWVVYLVGEKLDGVSKLIVPRVRMEARRRILEPSLRRNDFGWQGLDGKGRHLNNWTPWVNSNVLTAGLLLETDVGVRAELVGRVCKSVDFFVAGYSGDGACEEGPAYWGRSAASFFDVCWTLVSAHGGKGEEVLRHPFVKAMGHYIADVHIAKNLYVNYGDAHVEAAPEPEEVYRFGKGTGDGELRDFGVFEALRRGTGTSGQTLRRAMVTDNGGPASLSRVLQEVLVAGEIREAGAGKDALGRDAWYPKLQLMTAREKAGTTDGFFVALQAASNGRSHGHNDSGNFMVFSGGEPVFIDVGVEAYTAKTFGKDRYSIWTMQSGFHNLPTIGGVMQKEGDAFRASEVTYERGAEKTTVRGNLATAYPKAAGVQRWMRTLTLDRAAGRVVLEEDFVLAGPREVQLNLMTAKEPVVSGGTLRIGAVSVGFDAALWKAEVEKIALTDAALKWSWGEAVWRVKLVGTMEKGVSRLEMRSAA
jgi:hypothetical protein